MYEMKVLHILNFNTIGEKRIKGTQDFSVLFLKTAELFQNENVN